MESFFRANRVYAVAGATTNPAKFGHKVLKWYVDRDLAVKPINFRGEEILGLASATDITQVAVPNGQDLAVSVVTPPQVTRQLVENIGNAQGKVSAIWFQPDTYDNDTLKLAKDKVPTVIEGCVLVSGDQYLNSANL